MENNTVENIEIGTRILLTYILKNKYALYIPSTGDLGTIVGINADEGLIEVHWDMGYDYPLLLGTDDFKVLTEEEYRLEQGRAEKALLEYADLAGFGFESEEESDEDLVGRM